MPLVFVIMVHDEVDKHTKGAGGVTNRASLYVLAPASWAEEQFCKVASPAHRSCVQQHHMGVVDLGPILVPVRCFRHSSNWALGRHGRGGARGSIYGAILGMWHTFQFVHVADSRRD